MSSALAARARSGLTFWAGPNFVRDRDWRDESRTSLLATISAICCLNFDSVWLVFVSNVLVEKHVGVFAIDGNDLSAASWREQSLISVGCLEQLSKTAATVLVVARSFADVRALLEVRYRVSPAIPSVPSRASRFRKRNGSVPFENFLVDCIEYGKSYGYGPGDLWVFSGLVISQHAQNGV